VREIGLVEFPPAVKANRVEKQFPISTMDLMATVLDVLGLESHNKRSLDGISLLPILKGEITERPIEAGIGIHGSFAYGDTNHHCEGTTGNCTRPFACPTNSSSATLGDVPADFNSVAGNGPQFSWAEGNHLKLFGCRGDCTRMNCNGTAPGFEDPGWHFFLYNLTSDRAETTDLWADQRGTARAMFSRFQKWQASVAMSQGAEELGCAPSGPHPPTPGPPGPPPKYTPVADLQDVKARCSSTNENKIGGDSQTSVAGCATACSQTHGCEYFSYAAGCGSCWQYAECNTPYDASSGFVYTWSTFHLSK